MGLAIAHIARDAFLLRGDRRIVEIAHMRCGAPDPQLAPGDAEARALQGKALLAVLDAAGISGLTRNFVGTVAANGRARDLPAMATAFLAELASRRGETTATVTSAVPLSPAQLQQLSDSLRSVLGSNKVSIDARVEPDILGGLLVKVGSRLFDSSIRSKLQRLQLVVQDL